MMMMMKPGRPQGLWHCIPSFGGLDPPLRMPLNIFYALIQIHSFHSLGVKSSLIYKALRHVHTVAIYSSWPAVKWCRVDRLPVRRTSRMRTSVGYIRSGSVSTERATCDFRFRLKVTAAEKELLTSDFWS